MGLGNEFPGQVRLTQQEDSLVWRWTNDGTYSSKSAYEAQFQGSYCTFNCTAIWKAKVEEKHHFFAWLLLHSKVLTADNMMIHNWPCNQTCGLCDQAFETARHISIQCVFAQQVWVLVSWWTFGRVPIPEAGANLRSWWNSTLQAAPKAIRKELAAVLIWDMNLSGKNWRRCCSFHKFHTV
jgi:hypothetical protein